MRYEEEMPVSLVLRTSRSLKLRRSEVCLKKPGLEESWWGGWDVWLEGGWSWNLRTWPIFYFLPLWECPVQETRRKVKHICFPNNFSPALCLHKGSPWMEDLGEKKEKKIKHSFLSAQTNGSSHLDYTTAACTHFPTEDKSSAIFISVMFVLPDDSSSRCAEIHQRLHLASLSSCFTVIRCVQR